jgi:hypothetical protein
MQWLSENWVNVLAIATSAVTAASIAARMTPSEHDDRVLNAALKFIQWLSINGGTK